MKKLLVFLLAFILPLCISAEVLSRQDAQKLASGFLANKGVDVSKEMKMAYKAKHRKAPVGDNASYYIFNNGANKGFVIVAGDDNVEPILGYSTTGTFDENNIPANMKVWLEGYEEQIALASESKTANGQMMYASIEKEAIAPLVSATWGQGAPYNNQCPVVGTSANPSVTGCVATAMAQIMYYHKWPETSTAIPAYSINYTNIGLVTFDALEATTFDWNNMLPDYNGSESAEEQAAVAELMKYCGYGVKMGYSASSSGAYSIHCVDAFKSYFGYDSQVREVTRNDVSVAEWDNMIYNELSNGRPVYYSASNAFGVGHAFVCDGYEDGLFHINWGWDGMSDGYFRLQALNPSAQGIGGSSSSAGYSRAQSVIIGIQPPVSHETGAPADRLKTLAMKSVEGSIKSQFRVDFRLKNTSDASCRYDLGLGVFSGETLTQILYLGYCDFDLFESLGFSTTALDLSSWTDGTYSFKVYSRINGSTEWLADEGSEKHYVTVKISGDDFTIINNAKEELAVTAVEPQGDLIKGETAAVKVTVANTGNADYIGDLWFCVNGTRVTGEGVNIPAGGSDYVDYRVAFNTVGDNEIKICTDYSCTNVIYSGTVNVKAEVENSSSFELVSVEFDNSVLNNLYKEGVVSGKVTIKNIGSTRYNGNVYIMMTNKVGSSIYSSRLTSASYIESGGTKEIPFSVGSENIKYGSVINVYAGLIQSWDSSDYFGGSDAYTVKNVVPAWNAAGGQVAMDMESLTVSEDVMAVDFRVVDAPTSIVANSNPNTVYYFNEDATIPTALENSIVIKGGEAENVTLVDGKNLYIPESFVAKEILYKRTPSVYADGMNGWETIVLPFDVEEVTADGKEIDWFHSSSDTNKDFWLKEFVGVSGTTLLYDHVEAWTANTPYIIAIPGNKWGAEHDLTGKEIVFKGNNVEVKITKNMNVENGDYDFIGTTYGETIENVFGLNAAGNKFEKSASLASKPFRAYFSAENTMATSLGIGAGNFTGIDVVENAPSNGEFDVYTLSGQKVKTTRMENGNARSSSGLKKGIYIIGNKKILVK